MLLTISGLPGSGTSTIAVAVAESLALERVDGGSVWRSLGAELGMTVAEFSAFSETHPEVDAELDARLAARAHEGDVVLESRLAAWIAANEGLPALRVWVDCAEGERAVRVARRDGLDPDAALAANRARESSERLRYQTLYGIDLADRSIYELILDSTTAAPETLVVAIVEAVGPS